MFIRDGIIISDVRSRMIRDVHAIVAIEDQPLTEFLGDAENPAHTEWQEESSHFKGKYLHGAATLRYIRNFVADLCQLLTEAVDDEDPELLLDVFSVGTPAAGACWPVQFSSMTSQANVSTADNAQRFTSLKAKPRRTRTWRLTRREGGFRIFGRPKSDELNRGIEILVAYDRRNGSALRKYSITDFQLDQSPVQIEIHGAVIEIPETNRLIVYPDADSFDVTVTGFDKNRDLFLQARTSRNLTRIRSVREELQFE